MVDKDKGGCCVDNKINPLHPLSTPIIHPLSTPRQESAREPGARALGIRSGPISIQKYEVHIYSAVILGTILRQVAQGDLNPFLGNTVPHTQGLPVRRALGIRSGRSGQVAHHITNTVRQALGIRLFQTFLLVSVSRANYELGCLLTVAVHCFVVTVTLLSPLTWKGFHGRPNIGFVAFMEGSPRIYPEI
jgi:hypothetical protein